MSYSSRGNTLTSWQTKKTYTFTQTPDGSGKRLAIAQLEADNATYKQAAEARAGRPLTARELMELSNEKPKAQHVQHVQPTDDGKTNHYEKALASLRNLPEHTKDQRAHKKRMLAALEAGALQKAQEIEATLAREERLADPAVQRAIAHATLALDAAQTDPTIQQDDIVEARARLETLKSQVSEGTEGAVPAYYDASVAHRKAILDRLRAKQKEQSQRLDVLTEAVKSGELELAPTPGEVTPTT